jgi:hypothetical protein
MGFSYIPKNPQIFRKFVKYFRNSSNIPEVKFNIPGNSKVTSKNDDIFEEFQKYQKRYYEYLKFLELISTPHPQNLEISIVFYKFLNISKIF